VLGWGVAIVAVIFAALPALFVLTPLSSGSWQTSPVKRAPEQNQGGNAPAETSPAAGVKKNPQENTEMSVQQGSTYTVPTPALICRPLLGVRTRAL
jgi:hypothetical protein